MKKIIEGKVYNTDTAKYIAHVGNGLSSSDFRYFEENLYKTKKGQYFLVKEGGPMSKYSYGEGSKIYGDINIELISKENILKWFEDNYRYIGNRAINSFFEEFGEEIDEG
ncbi:MAG: hypothetical protein PHV23_05305 [Candidatus Gracilibacteria bacterium]|nr:hypothetical protein [Candidatus Gracilibacteria bacterium]